MYAPLAKFLKSYYFHVICILIILFFSLLILTINLIIYLLMCAGTPRSKTFGVLGAFFGVLWYLMGY